MQIELIELFTSMGAIGVLAWVAIMFARGNIQSTEVVEKNLKKIADVQASHITDLKEVTESHLKEIKGLLTEIRDDGKAMNQGGK